MLSKLKLYAGAAVGLIAVVWGIFFAGARSATSKIKAKAETKKAETIVAGYEAADAGRVREREIRKEKVNTEKRDFFE